MADPLLPRRLRDNLLVRGAERRVKAAVRRALRALVVDIRAYVARSNYRGEGGRWAGWEAAVRDDLAPVLRDTYEASYLDLVAGLDTPTRDARVNADNYLRQIDNRLVRASDAVWHRVRASLREGAARAEAMPDLAARVDVALREAGAENWAGRAETIARTETIAAFNNGRLGAGRALAAAVGIPERDVFKQWLSTRTDHRTRPTHVKVDGQTVRLNSRFTVGGAAAWAPGDPTLPPGECVNCRCTINILMPGDRGYPADHQPSVTVGLAAAGTLAFDFNPAQKRGPDGRWIKYLTQKASYLSLPMPHYGPTDKNDFGITSGPAYRQWMRAGRPTGHPDHELFDGIRQSQDGLRGYNKPTSENAMFWYRPTRYKDKDFPTNPKVGDVIQDQAPLTTEALKPSHSKTGIVYAVRVPEGSRGILPIPDDGKYGYYVGAQIPPGARLQVADVRDVNGQTVVTVDLLPEHVTPGPTPAPIPTPEPAPVPEPDVPQVGTKVDAKGRAALPTGSLIRNDTNGLLYRKADDGSYQMFDPAVPDMVGRKRAADDDAILGKRSTVMRVGPGDDSTPTPEPAPTPSAHKVGDVVQRADYDSLPEGTVVKAPRGRTEYRKGQGVTWERTDGSGRGRLLRSDLPPEVRIVSLPDEDGGSSWRSTSTRTLSPTVLAQRAKHGGAMPKGYEPLKSVADLPAGKPMSQEDARKGANPFNESFRHSDDGERRKARSQINAGALSSQFGINCQRVSAAYELRRRGYRVVAGAGQGGATGQIPEAWQTPNGDVRLPDVVNTRKALDARALQEGEGARFVVYGAWKKSGAHIWNAEVVDGKVVYYEGQVNGIDPNGGFFSGAGGYDDLVSWRGKGGFPGVYLLRVDDLEPHDSMMQSGWILEDGTN